jgi:succinate dehydrogenase / fumarate reductase cytochrome b subunit
MSNRPLSPHLTIYRPQITSILSIMHRFTGVIVFFATLAFAWMLIVSIYGDKSTVIEISEWFFECWLIKAILFIWNFSIFFHLFNGIRHLAWDTGYGLDDIAKVRRSGWLVVILAIASTIFSWSIIL